MYTKLSPDVGVINIQPLEVEQWYAHTNNHVDLPNLDPFMTYKNSVIGSDVDLRRVMREVRADYKEKWCRTMPATARPIRVGTVTITPDTTPEILEEIASELESTLNLETLQIHIHYDELGWSYVGNYEVIPHAHFIFLWYDFAGGKTLKLVDSLFLQLKKIVLDAIPYQPPLMLAEESEVSSLMLMKRVESKLDKLLEYEQKRHQRQRNKYLSVSDIGFITGVAEGTVYNWSSSGKLKGFKVNGKLRFLEEDVEHFIRNFEGGNYVLSKALEKLRDIVQSNSCETSSY